MGGSSFIELPACIEWKQSTININSQNGDREGFKWAILAKHVMGEVVCCVSENYRKYENKYNFSGIMFLTPLSDILT